ncbi:MAG: flippase-like domain-containing protein [Deltaproteobacteria bacterium]|nr:flippase-like domain-containing protein [Deltaproteobacteria bacterium]
MLTPLKKYFTLHNLFLISGFVLFFYLCYTLGFKKIGDLIVSFNYRFILIFALCLFWHAVNTLSWWLIIPPNKGVSYPKAYFVKMYTDALNIILPLFNMGGEGYRLMYLKKHFSAKTSLNGIFLDKALHFGSGFIFAFFGWYFLNEQVPLFAEKKEWVIGAGIFFMGLTFVLGWGPVLSKKYKKQIDVEQAIVPNIALWRVPLALFFRLVGWLLGSLEIYYVLHSLGHPVVYEMAYFITSFLVFLGLLSLIIPTNWGILEGSMVVLFSKLGLIPSVGLSLALIRRMRLLIFSVCGLISGYFLQRQKKRLNSPMCSGPNSHGFKKNIMDSSSQVP